MRCKTPVFLFLFAQSPVVILQFDKIVKIGDLVMRLVFHDGCLPDNRLEGLEDMLLLFLIVAYFSLFVQAHPVGKGPKAYGFSWRKPRVIRTESDTFYLYLPQATIWK